MGNIPDQVETWITARNVQRIKAVLLDKESYDSVCSGLEPMGNAFSGMEVYFRWTLKSWNVTSPLYLPASGSTNKFEGGEVPLVCCRWCFTFCFYHEKHLSGTTMTLMMFLTCISQPPQASLRCYAVTVHGVAILIQRMPNKQAREKSALLRECLICNCVQLFWVKVRVVGSLYWYLFRMPCAVPLLAGLDWIIQS